MKDSGFELPLPHPFDFQLCLNYMARSPFECLYTTDTLGVNRLVKVGVAKRLIRVTCPHGRMMQVQLLQGVSLAKEELEELTRYIRNWFDLDRDLEPFIQMSEGDPLLGQLIESFSGLRIVGIPDLFEALCWAIVGQQVNLTFAYKLKQRLTEHYGDAAEWEGVVYRMFPSPEQFASVSIESLLSLQLTRNKAMTILDVASRMTSGELSRERLLKLSDSESIDKELTKIRGIGPWTAQYVRMRCLGDQTALPIGDVGLQNAVKKMLGLNQKPTPSELRALFEQWPGWESYVTFYLWRTLY
ncbi:DNA-3-methyladenine glycosylase family protein [Paenibacillus radicis (ex Xue et al. 2023)]|uniref:DNA-3-methyladenine glycosylase II n=1 Tax=Paenibacillus radicis (ex Xue et al. 2023) TaxID=2972489 RepID=A0ABT1YB41_9BACL|nr:DNA-3-methyladenine glycosylase [Paenibacillus radicis (ex Xue et al. 2023)]MCR8630415.1 DNA-3-methyladenine glycosylase [Paenibacillus radicis (ex Xue et al. 2023)]